LKPSSLDDSNFFLRPFDALSLSADHTIQYMVAIPLIFGKLTTSDYSDEVASDPRIDALREKMYCEEEKQYSID
jgi:2-methylcitrate dehydratase PrpD